MDKKICPECGFEISAEELSVCPECGCPLNKENSEKPATEKASASDEQKSADNELSEAIEKKGCIATWHKRCKSEAHTANVLGIIDPVLAWCGIILGLVFFIYILVVGIKSDNKNTLFEYYNVAKPFIISITSAFVLSKLAETVAYNIETRNCALWLRSKRLDTRYCLELKGYGATKKTSISYDDHKVEVPFCAAHPEYIQKRIKTRVIKCLVSVISTVISAVSIYLLIEQTIIYTMDSESGNLYILIGCAVAMTVVEFVNWLVKRVLDKDFNRRTETWWREGRIIKY